MNTHQYRMTVKHTKVFAIGRGDEVLVGVRRKW